MPLPSMPMIATLYICFFDEGLMSLWRPDPSYRWVGGCVPVLAAYTLPSRAPGHSDWHFFRLLEQHRLSLLTLLPAALGLFAALLFAHGLFVEQGLHLLPLLLFPKTKVKPEQDGNQAASMPKKSGYAYALLPPLSACASKERNAMFSPTYPQMFAPALAPRAPDTPHGTPIPRTALPRPAVGPRPFPAGGTEAAPRFNRGRRICVRPEPRA